MADDCSWTSPRATSECEVPSGWYGLDLGCSSSQPRPSEPGIVDTPQASQREYRKLFFDCNLHLVLPQLLGQKCLPDANSTSQHSGNASLGMQGSTKHELTDSMVARLIRQHLNILVASQNASDAEVVAAAKILQQRFQPRMEAAQESGEVDLPGVFEKDAVDTGTQRRASLRRNSCDAEGLADLSLEEVTRSWLGYSSEDASQVAGEDASPDRGSRLPTVALRPPNDMKRSMTDLRTLHAQEGQIHGTIGNGFPLDTPAASERPLNRYAVNFSATSGSLEQPTKKVCVEIHDTG